ncbi:zinc-binding alcohol dehydrogenase [Nocardioides antri]|uniref:Zinc-binding alcohol dehydrogenase n=1 Tax=Nocardioides antri TaxID=2607659 RepID=A0A5B1LTZ0_9ACTN|nr:zinc-binding alcohol dehydrogenase [Nocardioides antri]
MIVVRGAGDVAIESEELPPVPDGGLLLHTLATGVSAGTELTFVKGDHPGVSRFHDAELGLFRPAEPDGVPIGTYPVRRLGYMEVARVAETRTRGFAVGDVVATTYGHATAHVSDPVREHVVRLPAELDPVLGTYVAHLGPICANGLLHAAADAVGPQVTSLGAGVADRAVAITGAGLIGMVTALFVREHGAHEVVVIDEDPRRRALAERLGFEALDADDDPGLALKRRWRHGPADHGADVVFQCRGRARALAAALRAARPQAPIVDLAFYTDGAEPVRLGEEFHHNGLRLVCAQIGRTPRGTAPWWDRSRLSVETLRLLERAGDEVRQHLVTDVVPFSDGPRLLLDVAGRRRHVVSAVLTVS